MPWHFQPPKYTHKSLLNVFWLAEYTIIINVWGCCYGMFYSSLFLYHFGVLTVEFPGFHHLSFHGNILSVEVYTLGSWVHAPGGRLPGPQTICDLAMLNSHVSFQWWHSSGSVLDSLCSDVVSLSSPHQTPPLLEWGNVLTMVDFFKWKIKPNL